MRASRPAVAVGVTPVARPTPSRLSPALALAGALVAVWLLWAPQSPDLAAQVYRAHLFAQHGFSLWDNGWYAGHYVPGYSLIFPPLASLIGLQGAGALAAGASTMIFGRLARIGFGARAPMAAVFFAVGAVGDLYIGRLTFALGVALALATVLAGAHGHRKLAALLSVACAAASPVAALFLTLVAVADFVAHREASRALCVGLPGLTLSIALTVLFPEGGYEAFSLTSLAAAGGLSLALLWLLPGSARSLRYGVLLYLGALVACYAVPNPMGSNAVRLGVLLAPPIFAGAVSVEDVHRALARVGRMAAAIPRARQIRGERQAGAAARPMARLTLLFVGACLLAWQVNGPVAQSLQEIGDPSLKVAYYTPVERFLAAQSHGGPVRVEAVFTRSHWDAVELAGRFSLARGWERQLDTKYDGLFYAPHLTAGAYHAWLLSTAVRFVALPDAPLDDSSRQEAALIRMGQPFLRPVFASVHWRVYAVVGHEPLAQGPGRLTAMDNDGFTLRVNRPGRFTVRVRYMRYWSLSSGQGCLAAAAGGWTSVSAPRREVIRVDARFSLGGLLTATPRCSPATVG
jgi:hypothetical protein